MPNKLVPLTGQDLTLQDLQDLIADSHLQVALSKPALRAVGEAHKFLQNNLQKKVIYGVNTGFGPMASHILGNGKLFQLQENLIRSHAVGMGNPIDPDFVLASMVVRLNTLCKGHSGVSLELIAALEKFINLRIIPVVPEHGAVGTSGDLVQLAHIALALLGGGQVYYGGKARPAAKVLEELKIKPYKLKPKEGLSLINGTAVMSGISSVLHKKAERILNLATRHAALALELVQAYNDSISEELHDLRPHPGQIAVARTLRNILKSSNLLRDRNSLDNNANNEKDEVHEILDRVQEVYSLRCAAQILGPVSDTLKNAGKVLQTEINAVTDNPIIDLKRKRFLHGGNFHGDYVSLSIDELKISLVKLTMLSERRINFFLNHKINRIFPPFLNLKQPGLTLGLQGLQFVATSTTAQSQTLAFPQYVHSIPTNADNQDIVSMGTDAALLASRVIDNAFVVLAVELITLAQAVDFLEIGHKLSKGSAELYTEIRKIFSKVTDDRELTEDLPKVLNLVKNLDI